MNTYKIQMPGNYPEKADRQLIICLPLAGVSQVVRCTDESACRLHLSCLKRQGWGWKWRVQLFC